MNQTESRNANSRNAETPEADTRYAGRRYHFVGVGGIGMSSLARLLMARGAFVSGSDRTESAMLEILRSEGAAVAAAHDKANLQALEAPPAVVVYSKAVPDDNPELMEARRLGIEIIHRAELLGELMKGRQSVCVCGTHGKTTTTAMLALILQSAGKDPAVMLGGMYSPVGGNARGGSGAFVAEACEAYGSFLSLWPEIAVVTNIEADHLDASTTFQDILDSFRMFVSRVPPHGRIIAGVDSPEVDKLLGVVSAPAETFGLEKTGPRPLDWTARRRGDGWEVLWRGNPVTRLRLQAPGDHNLLNALAAIAAARTLGVSPAESAHALETFTGVDRRFSIRGAAGGVLVVDDYAHHPSEIRATLAATRALLSGAGAPGVSPGQPAVPLPRGFELSQTGRLIAAFQPHLYTRTAIFMDAFVEAMEDADIVVVTEIYAAREDPIEGVSGAALAEKAARRWPEKTITYAADLRSLPGVLASMAREGDIVLTLGAGSITEITRGLLERLQSRGPAL